MRYSKVMLCPIILLKIILCYLIYFNCYVWMDSKILILMPHFLATGELTTHYFVYSLFSTVGMFMLLLLQKKCTFRLPISCVCVHAHATRRSVESLKSVSIHNSDRNYAIKLIKSITFQGHCLVSILFLT